MANLTDMMRDMYRMQGESLKSSANALQIAATSARKATEYLAGIINVEWGAVQDSNDPDSINTAIGNIKQYQASDKTGLVQKLGDARVRQSEERLANVKANKDIEKRVGELRAKGMDLKNIKPEDMKGFEKGLNDLEITLETGVYRSETEAGAQDAIKGIREDMAKLNLLGVLGDTDKDTRNVPQDMTETTTRRIVEARGDYSPAQTINLLTRKISEVDARSDEFFLDEANRRIAATRMVGGDDWREGHRKAFEPKFRSLNDQIGTSKGFITGETFNVMGIEGRFSEKSIMVPEYWQDRQYQLATFMIAALPRDLRKDVKDYMEKHNKVLETDTQRYNPEYIKAIYDMGMGAKDAPKGNVWVKEYEKRFRKTQAVKEKPTVETKSDWYHNLYKNFEDAYALYQDADRAIKLETKPLPENGVESVVGAGFQYNNALEFD